MWSRNFNFTFEKSQGILETDVCGNHVCINFRHSLPYPHPTQLQSLPYTERAIPLKILTADRRDSQNISLRRCRNAAEIIMNQNLTWIVKIWEDWTTCVEAALKSSCPAYRDVGSLASRYSGNEPVLLLLTRYLFVREEFWLSGSGAIFSCIKKAFLLVVNEYWRQK